MLNILNILKFWFRKQVKNTGLLDLGPQDGDWRAGAVSGIVYQIQNENGDWRPYLPSPEKQNSVNFDSFNCTSYAGLNAVEMQINKLLADGKISKRIIEGYLDSNGKFNGADRFSAIISGNTKQGNYMVNVPEGFRKVGILPESLLPHEDNLTWEEYHTDPKLSLHKEIASIFLNYFSVAYEWVPTDRESLKKHLKQAPIVLLTPLCKGFFTDTPVKTCSLSVPSHATVLTCIGAYNNIYDSYANYARQLSYDYPIIYAMKILITPKIINTKLMKWIILSNNDQYLIYEPLKLAFVIGDENDLHFYQKQGLVGQPERIPNLNGYTILRVLLPGFVSELKDKLN